VDGATDLLGVAECVHGDHDASLTRQGRASKVDSPGTGLSLKIVEPRSRVGTGLVFEAGFDVRLGRASPGSHRYLRVSRALGSRTSTVVCS